MKPEVRERVMALAKIEDRRLGTMAGLLVVRGLDAVILAEDEKQALAAVREFGVARALAVLAREEVAA